MRATDQIHVVFLQEARDYVWTKREGDPTVVLAPARNIFVRIGPEQVAKQATVRDLSCISLDLSNLLRHSYISRSHHTPDLLHGIEIRAQTTMHSEDLLVDDSRDRQAIEAVRESLP